MRPQLLPGLASARQCIAALESAQDLDAAVAAGRAFDQAHDAERWEGAWNLSWRGWQERLAELWIAEAGLPEQTVALGDRPEPWRREPTDVALGEVLDDDVVEQLRATAPAPAPLAARAPYARSLDEVAARGRASGYRGRRRITGHGRPR